MSRQRSEFIHRTTIFEGAFRAWSLTGTLDPVDPNESSPAAPCPDPFGLKAYSETEFAYEPLPRSGLQHPFVKAVLSPWLGPNVNQEAVELGLATLRTWWQHRRKGPNKTAEKALSDKETIKAVESYLKHFFTLAHCLVFRDRVQPPRSLQLKMKQADPKSFGQENSVIVIKGQCIPGAVDLEGMVKKVNNFTSTHRVSIVGNPDTMPMVFINAKDDMHFILDVGGITCAHCVKIVETVLRGCQGSQSPIPGIIDAAADRGGAVLVKIDNMGEVKRIAHQAIRNLALVGYSASARREVALRQFFGKAEAVEQVITLHSKAYPRDLFDWALPCSCPDSGVYRDNCQRHCQIDEDLFLAFDEFQERVLTYAQEKCQPPSANPEEGMHEPIAIEADLDTTTEFGRTSFGRMSLGRMSFGRMSFGRMSFTGMDELDENIEPLPFDSAAAIPHDALSGAMDQFPGHSSEPLHTSQFHDHFADFDDLAVFELAHASGPACTSCRTTEF